MFVVAACALRLHYTLKLGCGVILRQCLLHITSESIFTIIYVQDRETYFPTNGCIKKNRGGQGEGRNTSCKSQVTETYFQFSLGSCCSCWFNLGAARQEILSVFSFVTHHVDFEWTEQCKATHTDCMLVLIESIIQEPCYKPNTSAHLALCCNWTLKLDIILTINYLSGTVASP